MATVGGIPSNTPPADGHAGHSSSTVSAPGTTPFSAVLQSTAATPSHNRQPGMNLTSFPSQAHGQGGHNILEQALSLRAYRLELIASNIANADTPNYKAKDFNFQEALRATASAYAAVNSSPLQNKAVNPFAAIPLKYHVPQQASADGNTVEMDVERTKFAENAVMYEANITLVRHHYMMMMDALKD
jgi:flagellar basal-body rod protein FlgB